MDTLSVSKLTSKSQAMCFNTHITEQFNQLDYISDFRYIFNDALFFCK